VKALAALLFLAAAVLPAAARAGDGPSLGGCVVSFSLPSGNPSGVLGECALEVGPAVVATVGRYGGGKFGAGFMPGACYGPVLFPERWYRFGIAGCGQLSVGGSDPGSGTLSVLGSFANYLWFGSGWTWTEQPEGPARKTQYWLFGIGTKKL
jgi:hypothetical protein